VSALPPALRVVLQEAQQAGAIGPGSIDDAVAHARAFMPDRALGPAPRCVDLGSGGGLPGLPLALELPGSRWTLLDAWAARVAALQRAIVRLGLADRVVAVHARAEDAGRSEMRAAADLVVARGFGPPPQTAECAAPLLRAGGLLVVSAAAEADTWPHDGVPALGLVLERDWQAPEGRFLAFRREGELSARFPRRIAAQGRRPLF
jgi:16S rRNA (guanine527-N7)-methyltransferase